MRNIKDYLVITYTFDGATKESFSEQVNEFIKNGWQPFGNPFIGNPYTNTTLFQAVVKYEEGVLDD